ncbi:MAG: hypothetical protein ABIM30_09510 [candidate division WOR-3 bacterium]
MTWIDYHNKFFDFKPLADEALLNKLVDEAVKTDEFRKFRNFNIGGGESSCLFRRPLIRYTYDDFNDPVPDYQIKRYDYDIRKGYTIDIKTKKRIMYDHYFSFYALKSLLHFKFKYNIPYYGTEFFSTPFHWIEEEPLVDMYKKYENDPTCKDYQKYGHIGKVAEISIVDDRLKNLEFMYEDEDYDDYFCEFSKRKRFAALKKALGSYYPSAAINSDNKRFFLSDSEVLDRIESTNPDIDLERDLTQEQYFAEREKYSIINPSDKFFRQFCVKFIARLIALDLGYFICKYNYNICRFLQFNKVSKVSYTVNLFEFDVRTFSHPRAQEVFKIVVKEVVNYLTEIFTNRAFINFEMDDFKFEYVDVEVFPGIKITDPLERSFVIRFDFWNMNPYVDNYTNNYVGYGSIKNTYENTYPSRICGERSDYCFTFWSPVVGGIGSFTPFEIDFGRSDPPAFDWLFWRDYRHMLYNRFLGAYYHKEPVEFRYRFNDVEEDMSFMRECFENYLLKYLESTGNCEQYFAFDSDSPVVNRSWFYGRRNLSISQVSFLDIPAPAGFMSFGSTKLAVDGSTTVCDTKARERFDKYYMKLFFKDNFYEFK